MAEPAQMRTKNKPTSVAQMGLIIFTSIVRRVVRLRQALLLVSCRPGGNPRAEIRNPKEGRNPKSESAQGTRALDSWSQCVLKREKGNIRQFSFIDFAEFFLALPGFTRPYQALPGLMSEVGNQ